MNAFADMDARDQAHSLSVGDEQNKSLDFIDNDDSYCLRVGEQYWHAKTGRIFTVIGGEEPAKWDDRTDRLLVATLADMDGYSKAIVRDEEGLERSIFPGMLYGFITDDAFLGQPPMRFWSYDDMLAMPEPEWIIDSVIQEKTSALMFGSSNSFKSFLGIDMMMSVATGRDWHGHAVGDPMPCIYVATEGSRGVATQRVPGWVDHHGMDESSRYNFLLCPDEIALDDEGSVNRFLKTCAHWKAWRTVKGGGRVADENDHSNAAALIVIDIFGASMLGSESSDETARAWVKSINRIMDEMGCAVLTIAHSGWADKTRARMHSHFWGSFDTRMIAEGDKDSLTTVLRIDRHKDADSEGEWGFRLDKVDAPKGQTTLVPRLCDDVETNQKRRVSGKPAVALQALSEALIDQGRTIAGPNYSNRPVITLAQWRTMCDRHGLTDSDTSEAQRKAFNRAKSALIEKGLVKQFDDHVWKVSDDA